MLSTLLSILFMILKIIGIILLFLLALVCIVLFAPIRYELEGEAMQGQKPAAYVKVEWLWFLVRFHLSYFEKELQYRLKVFGYPLMTNIPEDLKKKEKKQKQKEEKQNLKENVKKEKLEKVQSQKTNQEKQIIEPEDSEVDKEEPLKIPDISKEDQKNPQESIPDSAIQEEKADFTDLPKKEAKKAKDPDKKAKKDKNKNNTKGDDEKKEGRLDFLKKKYAQAGSFMDEYQVAALMNIAKVTILRILHHILPGKLSGYVHFGFEDPSITGKFTGLAAMFYPKYGKTFTVEPDFQDTVIEGKGKGTGWIQIGFFLWIILTLLLKKEVRKIVGFILK